jgi:hypothetical protein
MSTGKIKNLQALARPQLIALCIKMGHSPIPSLCCYLKKLMTATLQNKSPKRASAVYLNLFNSPE